MLDEAAMFGSDNQVPGYTPGTEVLTDPVIPALLEQYSQL
jgi:hypothetical protein